MTKHDAAIVSRALANVCLDLFLQIDVDLCEALRPVEVRPRAKGSAETYATWKPVDSVFFTLIKYRDFTVAYCHANGQAYHAAPLARLAGDCPHGTAFLCQFCLDNGGIPRLLVFDLLEKCEDVAARGQHLRNMARYLPLPLCTVQWSGEVDALEGFTSKLPHKVECVVGLNADPLRLSKYMRIALPKGMPGVVNFEGFIVR